MLKSVTFLTAVLLATAPVLAAGDLATKATKLPALELGGGDAGYDVSEESYELETGKSYTLTIRQIGPHGCEWEAEDLTRNVWIRNIEVEHVTINTGSLEGFELDSDAEVEITFVPIRTGEYGWECEGLDEKGMEGTFVVK